MLLTEDGDEGKEADEQRHGQQHEHQGVELVALVGLLVEGVGGHGVVVVVQVPGGHGRLVARVRGSSLRRNNILFH